MTAINWIQLKQLNEFQQLNILNAAPGDQTTFKSAADVKEMKNNNYNDKSKRDIYNNGIPKYKFWLDFDFFKINNGIFHHEDYYPFFGGGSLANVGVGLV